MVNNLIDGLKNLKRFFWVIWGFRGFDYIFSLRVMKKCLETSLTPPFNEVSKSRLSKEVGVRRVIEILDNVIKDPYIEKAEIELGKHYNYDFRFVKKKDQSDSEQLYTMEFEGTPNDREWNHKLIVRSEAIKEKEWEELFNILKTDMQGWWY